MAKGTRRAFLKAAASGAAATLGLEPAQMLAAIPLGERPRRGAGVEVINPQARVPLSFFIDDSTCLVNMGHFCMPQFAEAWPDSETYEKPWKTWPREIPDAFLREFGEWCAEHGVKGKYSVVPYPACVGWLDRERRVEDPTVTCGQTPVPLREVRRPCDLAPGVWLREQAQASAIVCFDLPKGETVVTV